MDEYNNKLHGIAEKIVDMEFDDVYSKFLDVLRNQDTVIKDEALPFVYDATKAMYLEGIRRGIHQIILTCDLTEEAISNEDK